MLLSGLDDGSIMKWCGQTGACMHTLISNKHGCDVVLSLAVGCDGTLYSGHESGTILVWD
jgi:WD40 repeat protein